MKTLIAAVVVSMAVVAFGTSLVATATAESAPPQRLAGLILNPAIAPKERTYSIPVQNTYNCDCSGERGCISRLQCIDTGGKCHRDCGS